MSLPDGDYDHILFLDESGNHGLLSPDDEFPVFVLFGCLVRRAYYLEVFDRLVTEFKKTSDLQDERTVLQSHAIRKAKAPFQFLMQPEKKNRFYAALNGLIQQLEFLGFGVLIDKNTLKKQYAYPANPYALSLVFIIERVTMTLNRRRGRAMIIAEARGKREDAELSLVYEDTYRNGTAYVPSQEIQNRFASLVFREKRDNLSGLQMADLCAYPLAVVYLRPGRGYQPFDLIEQKLHRRGYKVFP
jgi:hypothetical protein